MPQKQQNLFKSRLVPAKEGSGKLFEEELAINADPVTCLGMTFENDEARRAHFTEELRKKLQDPEFRKIEGFPLLWRQSVVAAFANPLKNNVLRFRLFRGLADYTA